MFGFFCIKTTYLSLLLSISFTLISLVSLGQNAILQNPEQSGDRYFLAEQYFRAAQYYQLALTRDTSNHQIAIKLAHSERNQFNYAQAAEWYQYAQNLSTEFSADAAYYQSLMLKNIGRCREAYPWLDSLLNSAEPEFRELRVKAQQLKQSCQEIDLLSIGVKSFDVTLLDSTVNSSGYDYAPVVMGNDSVLLLTSTRFAGKKKISYRFGENNANFFAFRLQGDQYVDTSTFVSKINTTASEGSACFVEARREFYFTYCGNDQHCQIYFVAHNGKGWTDPTPLPASINREEAETKHPSVSVSGDSLFFVSDRTGGHGGLDIWMSIRAAKDQWLAPVCLDSTVNSKFDEVSPHYHSQQKVLYFASNNQRGFGGMDVYAVSDFTNREARTRRHLPMPINSSADDSYLALGQQLGYLASNREGNFNIYRFKKNQNQNWLQFLSGIPVLPSTPESDVTMITPSDKIRRVNQVDTEAYDWIWVNAAQHKRLSSGATRFILNSDVNDIQMRQYQQSQRLDTGVQKLEPMKTLVNVGSDKMLLLTKFKTDSIDTREASIVNGKVATGTNQEPLAEQTIELRGSAGELLKTSTTNENGEFKFVNLPGNSTYSIALTSDEALDTISVSDLVLQTKPEYATPQTFEPIYFNFNQHELRPESAEVLETLAKFYQSNPSISIEINAFTDSLGSDVYNVLLSEKRGEAAFNFLISAGVDRSALAINANGVSTAYTSTNAYVSQQLNRRVEFEVFGLDRLLPEETTTKILRPNIDITQLLEGTKMTREELSELNGRPLDVLIPYKPIRIYKNEITDANSLFYQIIDIN